MPRATTSKALLLLGCAVALAAAGARGAVLTTAVGDYEPTSDMDMSELCGLSDAVSKIKDLLGAESPDFDAIKAAYEDGAQALATADYSGTMYFDKNAAYFNSTTWIDDYILSAIEDTIPGADLSARLEIIEKTAMDAIAVNSIMYYLDGALNDTSAWDAAAALYTGCGDNNTAGGPGSAPYGRATKRGANYGTADEEGNANANKKAMAAFAEGAGQALEGSVGVRPETVDAVVDAIQTTYGQAATRYGFKVDGACESGTCSDYEEVQGEGWAFWRVIEAHVADVDPDAAAAITKMYTVDGEAPDNIEGGNYCAILKAVDEVLKAEDFGVLEDTEDVTC